jgi:hypothetical protein
MEASEKRKKSELDPIIIDTMLPIARLCLKTVKRKMKDKNKKKNSAGDLIGIGAMLCVRHLYLKGTHRDTK